MRKRLTHEEFIEKVLQKNKYYANGQFEIVGRYINYHLPIECYCKKHNLYWSPTPASLCDGWGCPSCGTESTANHNRLTHEDFIEKLSQNNQYYINGDITIIGTYVGSNKPIECHCNIHNVDWSPIPSNLYRGCGCPECGKEAMMVKNTKIVKNGFSKTRNSKIKNKKSKNKNNILNEDELALNKEGLILTMPSRMLTHEEFLERLVQKKSTLCKW